MRRDFGKRKACRQFDGTRLIGWTEQSLQWHLAEPARPWRKSPQSEHNCSRLAPSIVFSQTHYTRASRDRGSIRANTSSFLTQECHATANTWRARIEQMIQAAQ
jgi:hypothetical protein